MQMKKFHKLIQQHKLIFVHTQLLSDCFKYRKHIKGSMTERWRHLLLLAFPTHFSDASQFHHHTIYKYLDSRKKKKRKISLNCDHRYLDEYFGFEHDSLFLETSQRVKTIKCQWQTKTDSVRLTRSDFCDSTDAHIERQRASKQRREKTEYAY